MNTKNWIIIWSFIAATLLPFSSNSQEKKGNIINKTNKELITNIQREILDQNGKRITLRESHEEIVNMPIDTLQKKYKENIEVIFAYHMLEEINKRRKELGLNLFIMDETLTNKCKKFAKYMADNKSRWHEINWKTSFDMWINTDNFEILRENTTYENTKISIFKIVENRQYLDDENDKRRNRTRELRENHKLPIIAEDSDKFWCGFIIDWKKIYVVMNSWSTF